jgi:hypothetical protein
VPPSQRQSTITAHDARQKLTRKVRDRNGPPDRREISHLTAQETGVRFVSGRNVPHALGAQAVRCHRRSQPRRPLHAKIRPIRNRSTPLRALPSCEPINRDHAPEHERKSELCFEVWNETRNPPRRGRIPNKNWGMACAHVPTQIPLRKSPSRCLLPFVHPIPPHWGRPTLKL